MVVEPAAVRRSAAGVRGRVAVSVREVAVDAERGPAVELRLHGARAPRGMSRASGRTDKSTFWPRSRPLELAAQRAELVGGVERAGAREPGCELQCEATVTSAASTVPQRLHVRASTLP